MDFGRYLYFTQRLTQKQYSSIVTQQLDETVGHAPANSSSGLATQHLRDVENVEPLRETPFGDMVLKAPEIAERLFGTDRGQLKQLLEEWHQWHLENLEPICTYSLATKIRETSLCAPGREKTGGAVRRRGKTVQSPYHCQKR